MKALLPIALAAAIGCALVGCAAPPPTPGVEPQAALTQDGLRPLARSGFARAWVRPGVSFARFDRIRTRYEGISYRRIRGSGWGRIAGSGGDDFALPGGVERALEGALRRIFQVAISRDGAWRMADASGAGVLLVRVALADAVFHAPLGTLGGDDFLYLDSLGEITLLVELYDSESQQLIGRLLERRALTTGVRRPVRATVGDLTYEAHRMFRGWAEGLRALLAAMKQVQIASAADGATNATFRRPNSWGRASRRRPRCPRESPPSGRRGSDWGPPWRRRTRGCRRRGSRSGTPW